MAAEVQDEPHDWDALSMFRHKYKIPSIKTNQARWDKGWEKTLRTLSASDVFPILSPLWKGNRSEAHRASLPSMSDGLYKSVGRIQKVVLELEEQLEESDAFVIAWLLLDEAERKRHLFNGMKETCNRVSLHNDGRALCPEITTTAMLKQNGRAFIDFARDFVFATKEAGADDVYLLPSEWWLSAVSMPEPWPEDVKFAFTQLSFQRNEFISHFVVHTSMSVMHDLSYGSPGMDKVTDLLKADSNIALGWAKTLSSKRDKPLIRCENCTKTSEEIEGNPKFMVCSNCRSKLDFVVHYCSQTCQKDDWRSHKKHCGKEKIAKKLPGTIHDRSWAYPTAPESLRSLVEATPDGNVPITSIGFGTPHPSHPHPPALQRQVALLEGDRDADYFLFDDTDRPVRFMLHETFIKMCFRMIRSEVMFAAEPVGAEALAEYLIKIMADWPGLSRERILAQFEREYGGDMAAKMADFEAHGVESGYEPGRTFLETMSASMRTMTAHQFPGMM